MNIQLKSSIFGTMGTQSFFNQGLESTKQKLQRQAERDNKIAFFENQKENLKNMECDSLEEISKKLDMFHTYEDQIAAAKEEYNQSQMLHAMDEARERGEKIAEAAEKFEPKTAEERQEEKLEEARGTDEGNGMLTELLEELSELDEELSQEALEEMSENSLEELAEETAEGLSEETLEEMSENSMKELSEETAEELSEETLEEMSENSMRELSEEAAEGLSEENSKSTDQTTVADKTQAMTDESITYKHIDLHV